MSTHQGLPIHASIDRIASFDPLNALILVAIAFGAHEIHTDSIQTSSKETLSLAPRRPDERNRVHSFFEPVVEPLWADNAIFEPLRGQSEKRFSETISFEMACKHGIIP